MNCKAPQKRILFDPDKPHDHCGVFGIYGHPRASQMTYYGLHALQHRGQEGPGIVTSHIDENTGKSRFHVHKDFGLVNDVFKDDSILSEVLVGSAAIGHNRYSTAGASNNKLNIRPFIVNYRNGNIAISHNGNLTNFRAIRERLQNEGTIFQTTSDTEVILHLIARSKETDQLHQIVEAFNQLDGAFSVTILTDDKLVAARDSHGWRPLALGRLGKAFVVASETCAFDIINVPHSSNTATLGYESENNKLGNRSKFEIGLILSHYVGRTFIQPDQDVRQMRVKTKFNTVKSVLKGKRVVIVDDSIVRGTTSKQLVKLIRDAGAKGIHVRVTSPMIRFPCYYGMDFPNDEELIANLCEGNVEKIRQELGVDSMGYLSLERLLEAVPREHGESYCTACFNGNYPTQIEARGSKDEYEM